MSAATLVVSLASTTAALSRPPHRPGPFIPTTTIAIVSTRAPVSHGAARVRLSCAKGEAIILTCHGTLTLRGRVAGANRVVGRTRFAIQNCCMRSYHVVAVRLTRSARSHLRYHHTLRVSAEAVLAGQEARGRRAVVIVAG